MVTLIPEIVTIKDDFFVEYTPVKSVTCLRCGYGTRPSHLGCMTCGCTVRIDRDGLAFVMAVGSQLPSPQPVSIGIVFRQKCIVPPCAQVPVEASIGMSTDRPPTVAR